jgi:uncharacterized protein (DUF697 family)/GTP-binding protein EngB required for normal cell division
MSEGPDNKRRTERMLDEGVGWTTRAGADVAESLARAWRGVFGDNAVSKDSVAREEPERSGADDLEAGDASELFNAERRREMERMGHANILIIGQTGVGKSTLINAVFRKPLAQTSMGRPVTKVIERFEDPDVPVTLYDSRGVELGDSKDRVIKDFKRTIAKSRKARPEHHIHLLWYCMDAGQTRVQDYDLEIIAALAEEVPVLVVFTQTIDHERADALEKALAEAEAPGEGRPIRTLATARRIGSQTLEPVGLDELVRATNDVLPEAVKRAFINAQGVVLDLKVDHSHLVILTASAAAAAAAAAPIPAADAVVLKPIQIGMMAGITAIFGVDISNDAAAKLIGGVLGQGGMESAGKKMAKLLAKQLPGGNVINAAVAAALTGALGKAYIRLCSEMLQREADGRPMPNSEMLTFLLNAYQSMFPAPGGKGKATRAQDKDSA